MSLSQSAVQLRDESLTLQATTRTWDSLLFLFFFTTTSAAKLTRVSFTALIYRVHISKENKGLIIKSHYSNPCQQLHVRPTWVYWCYVRRSGMDNGFSWETFVCGLIYKDSGEN